MSHAFGTLRNSEADVESLAQRLLVKLSRVEGSPTPRTRRTRRRMAPAPRLRQLLGRTRAGPPREAAG